MMKKRLFLYVLLSCQYFVSAQVQWLNPVHLGSKLHGQIEQSSVRSDYFQRLPDQARSSVSDGVWYWSGSAAGESFQFYTNSQRIIVRYTVSDSPGYPHMPATGKSGVDLYAYDENGQEKWCAATYQFSDTITYTYEPLIYDQTPHSAGYEYHLYLPLYNRVTWLEIGVDSSSLFRFTEPSIEKPIIIYGTSIAQGACASRPGMAWSNIVERTLQTPVINLGFSGNGLLEPGMLDIIKATPAQVVVLDCMPNLFDTPKAQLTALIVKSVYNIRSAQPHTPILLTDHLGYPHGTMIGGWKAKADNSVTAQNDAYQELITRGMTDLYYLRHSELHMPADGTVEGIHPSDYGMQAYATAYIRILQEILHRPIGTLSSQQPVTQRREPQNYEWRERHQTILEQTQTKVPTTVILGNSIMHFWGGVENFQIQYGAKSWNDQIKPLNTLNMGCGWDRIENVLWRIYHGALDGYSAQRIIVTIGINNVLVDQDDIIPEGIRTLIQAIKVRQPHAKIKINGIFPARRLEERVAKINGEIQRICDEEHVVFTNPGRHLLAGTGQIDTSFFLGDQLHLNEAGYQKIVTDFLRFPSKSGK